MKRYTAALGQIVGTVSLVVHAIADLLGTIGTHLGAPGPEKGTGVEAPEPPGTIDGPDSYVENSGRRGDELMHAETRRDAWRNDEWLEKSRSNGTRKIGF